jgi:hypothetical protein
VSGYFDNPNKLVAAADSISQAKGIYITLNPVNPALLAHAANRLRSAQRDLSTSDDHILRRRWLPIDCDPVRPSGISATDTEHDVAIIRSREICEALHLLGWPEPIMADSGNGGHLLYLVDLPNDDPSKDLFEQVLQALAFRFNDETVVVDQTNFNAGRTWKLYGTMACKGDNTPNRPHRLSHLLRVPEVLIPVPIELLREMAQSLPVPEEASQAGTRGNRQPFDLERWIVEHGLDVSGPHPWQKGRKWIFTECPWNADHRDRAAYIAERSSGAIAAGCLHNGCSGKEWHDLRALVEPRWREQVDGHPGEWRSPGVEVPAVMGKALENRWTRMRGVPTWLSEPEEEFQGLAKDLITPGALTLVASPQGLWKTQVSHALAVALATAGVFRGERVKPARVMLLDRDNPETLVKRRLRAWGAIEAKNLHVLTRQNAPALQDKAAWHRFPLADYDVLIVDSVGSSTEGITEKEG